MTLYPKGYQTYDKSKLKAQLLLSKFRFVDSLSQTTVNDNKSETTQDLKFSAFVYHTGSPCNSQILGEMKIRELQNREF